jgi:hypothetical protein
VNSTVEGLEQENSIELEWSAMRRDDACAAGTDPLVLTAHTTAAVAVPRAYYADCISKLLLNQSTELSPDSGTIMPAGGFWASYSDSSEFGSRFGFNYSWTGADARSAEEGDGSIQRLAAPGQMPSTFYEQGFTALASSQQGLSSTKLPAGSYRLEFHGPQVCDLCSSVKRKIYCA